MHNSRENGWSRDGVLLRRSELLNRGIWAMVLLMLLAALILFAPDADAQTPSVAAPVGFIRVVATNSHLLAMPFVPFDPAVSSVFAGQLAEGDVIGKWNPVAAEYERVAMGADGNCAMAIGLGDAFFVQKKSGSGQTLFLSGAVPMTASQRMLARGLNTAGVGYPTAIPFAESGLAAIPSIVVKDQISLQPPASLEPGKGFWVQNQSGVEAMWSEIPPWDTTLFGESIAVPRISGIRVLDGEKSVELTIAAGPGAFDVLYMDIANSTSRVDIGTGWNLAAEGVQTAGKTQIAWKDGQTVDGIYGRLYAVIASDVNLAAGGKASLRELLIGKADARSAVTRAEGASTALKIAGGGKAGGSAKMEIAGAKSAGRAIFVDSRNGSDEFDGADSSAAIDRATKRGPKRSINAALRAVGGTVGETDDAVIYVAEGEYTETVRNSKARMIAVGRVILK